MNKEHIAYIVKNKAEIIRLKKAERKFSEPMQLTEVTEKSISTNYEDKPETGIIKRLIIGNTYNWMDSQGDVLLDNTFAKSINERSKDIFHLRDHNYEMGAKVGRPVSFQEKAVKWADLGVNIDGETQALFMESEIVKDYNPAVFTMYLNNEVNQHSVGMQYIQLDLAVNDPEMKDEFALWQKLINKIGNKQDAEAQGYFWAVKEGKLFEVSAVLRGANSLTPTVENKLFCEEVERKKTTEKQQKDFYTNIAEHIRRNGLK